VGLPGNEHWLKKIIFISNGILVTSEISAKAFDNWLENKYFSGLHIRLYKTLENAMLAKIALQLKRLTIDEPQQLQVRLQNEIRSRKENPLPSRQVLEEKAVGSV
jgi:hypothetical protein